MNFEIRYGLGGGFGGAGEWEDAYATTLEDAEIEAYEKACEVYESYEGMYCFFGYEALRGGRR